MDIRLPKAKLLLTTLTSLPVLAIASSPASAALLRVDFNFKLPNRFDAAPDEIGTGYVTFDPDIYKVNDMNGWIGYPSSHPATEFRLDFLGRTFTNSDDVHPSGITVHLLDNPAHSFCGIAFTPRVVPPPLRDFEIWPDCGLLRVLPYAVDIFRGSEVLVRSRGGRGQTASTFMRYTLVGDVSPAAIPILEPLPVPTPVPTPLPTPDPTPIPIPIPDVPTPVPIPFPTPDPTPVPTPPPTLDPTPTLTPIPPTDPSVKQVPEPGAILGLATLSIIGLMCRKTPKRLL